MKYSFDAEKHIHSLDGQPLTGTSSVGDVLFKPLSWWAAGEAVKTLGWTHPKIKKNGKVIGTVSLEKRLKTVSKVHKKIIKSSPEEYLKLLDNAYRAHADSLEVSAERGSKLHADLEIFIKSQMRNEPCDLDKLDKRLTPFVTWSMADVKRYLWCEAHCYDEELWVGGISDAGAELKDGSFAIIDHKSSKEAYATHFMQAGGYAIQLEKNGMFDEDGNQLGKLEHRIDKIIIFPFGADVIEPDIREQMDLYKDGFRLGVQMYRILGLDKKLS